MGNKLSFTRNDPINSTDLESGVALGARGISSSDKEEAEARPLWMRVLHRVPPGLRENKERIYDPSIMSLGPYHHGQPQLRQLEQFKDEVVKVMLKEEEKRHLFRAKILERIDDIRHFYGGLSRDELNDGVLADMMLRDACTLLFFLELHSGKEDDTENILLAYKMLGIFHILRLWDDVTKVENQIPWWLMKSLISLKHDDHDEFIRKVFSNHVFGNYEYMKQLPWDDRDEYNPLHFLEAFRKTIQIMVDDDGLKKMSGRTRAFRSVRELKAKGIYFKPGSRFINKMSFRSYYVFGVLQLPVLDVFSGTKVAFSNIMALEMSPGSPSGNSVVTSHMTFMKSMIQSTEDVKLLQEKGIIVTSLDNNEEIVKMFKEMDTFGIDMLQVYDEIKIRINHHCDSKSRTWIAELINTNFRSPWATIALLAAALLLCFTFLQTYYTINPK